MFLFHLRLQKISEQGILSYQSYHMHQCCCQRMPIPTVNAVTSHLWHHTRKYYTFAAALGIHLTDWQVGPCTTVGTMWWTGDWQKVVRADIGSQSHDGNIFISPSKYSVFCQKICVMQFITWEMLYHVSFSWFSSPGVQTAVAPCIVRQNAVTGPGHSFTASSASCSQCWAR